MSSDFSDVSVPDIPESEVASPSDNEPSPSGVPAIALSSPAYERQNLIPDISLTCQSFGLLDPKLSEARRRQLDVINKLHSLGAQLDIDIPQIVVIGSQSAGKSSLIESISGITLPRSSGTCTRCPTECRLIHSSKPWECLVSLRFLTDDSGTLLQKVINVPFGPPIRDPKEVEERLRRAQRAALNPLVDPELFLTSNQTHHSNALDFTRNCVSLEIRGPDVTDLSFCDLPGLIASVSDTGRDEDVEKVNQLVSSYISKPSCIILLTVACETDFETQGAYRLAKQHDKNGTRTIGVLTKPDRIPDGEEARWIRLIKNESSPLENGWHCVKQPSTMELEKGISFQEARRRGEAFFRNSPWSMLEADHKKRLGTQALTQKLNEYLMALIAKRFPELMQEVEKVLQQTKEELQRLPLTNFKDPVMELMHDIGDFSDDLFRHAEGISYDISNSSNIGTQDNAFERIAIAHETFRQRLRATAPDFRPFDNEQPEAHDSYNARTPSPRLFEEICPATPRAHSYAEEVPNPSFLGFEEADHPPYSSVPIYLDDVVRRVKRATTRELPGYYPFQVLQDLISCSTTQWEEPARSLVNSIYWIVFENHNKLVEKYFGKYTAGGLRQAVSKIIREYMQKHRDEAVERVRWLLELEAHAFTLNKHYLDSYREKFLTLYREQRQAHLGRHVRLPPPEPWNANQYGLEIMATVRAYFQVAYKRIVDILPLAVDRELVRVQKRDMQEAITLGLKITGPESHKRCEGLLAEPAELIAHREELRNRLERLTNAQSELVDA